MKRSITRGRRPLLLALAAALVVGAAIAAPPGPTAIGDFYYYFDASGNTIGYRAIDCYGNYSAWGTTSNRYSVGHAYCVPR